MGCVAYRNIAITVSVRVVTTLLAHKLFDSPALDLIQAWWQNLRIIAFDSRRQLPLPVSL